MRDVEISRPTDPTPGREGPGPVPALVRWHGIPIGRSAAADGRAILLAQHSTRLLQEQVRAVLQSPRSRDRLSVRALLGAAPALFDGPWPLVTVAVCTRDRPADLARCLDGMLALDYPALDLLVIDNAPSSDATARVVAERSPRLRYVVESRPGLNWARNRAVHEARGDVLAFTDDDAVVDRRWVSALARVFCEDPDVMVVTGLVIPDELETEAQRLFEHYGGFGRGYTRRWCSVSHRPDRADSLYLGTGLYGTGANMAFRRRVFTSIGEFDPALDVGTATRGGGDLDMFFRVLHHGLLLVYEPAAVVRHRHRRTLAELERQLAGWGSGFYAYLSRTALTYPARRWAIIRFGLWYFWVRYLRRLGLSVFRSPAVPRRLMLAELRGALFGVPRYYRARAIAARIAASWPDHAGPQTPGAR